MTSASDLRRLEADIAEDRAYINGAARGYALGIHAMHDEFLQLITNRRNEIVAARRARAAMLEDKT